MKGNAFTMAVGILALCLAAADSIGAADPPDCDDDNGGLILPDGFCALEVANGLGHARHITVADNGDIYVALRERDGEVGGIAGLRDNSGNGRMDERIRFGESGGTGIGLHEGFLYFGEDQRVLRYRLQEKHLGPEDDPEVIVHDFPAQQSHASKSFTFDDEGNLYVNVGAPSNSCQAEDRSPGSPGRAPCPDLNTAGGIWKFDATAEGQTQADGVRYATGIRNALAIAWNPLDAQLYVVQHGRDQLSANWGQYYDDGANAELPSEEFLRVTEGADFGWPYCYHDPRRNRRMLAPEYGGNGRNPGLCNDRYPPPELAFPAHYAPNALHFYQGEQFPDHYRNGAFVAFHGSWDRAPLEQHGYMVAFVPMDEDGRVTEGKAWEVFADGFAGKDSIDSPDQAAHRPMGLAEGPDGSLYISDSREGRIWRVIYQGDEPQTLLGRQAEALIRWLQ
ncbi:MAG: PQQ-dependent sugar dehydrogenase [Aquisalimonadaceae bacterium]